MSLFWDKPGKLVQQAILNLEIPKTLIRTIMTCLLKGDFLYLKYSALIRCKYTYIYFSNLGRCISFEIENLCLERQNEILTVKELSTNFLISNHAAKQINNIAKEYHFKSSVKYHMYF